MVDTFLDIVDENDLVIGQALRSEVHAKGLWHREVGVFFVTPSQEIIFQIRSAFVDVNPNRASPTVGGHVDTGMTYEQAAINEMLEETGVVATMDELHLIKYTTSDKPLPDGFNRSFRKIYGYVYHGRTEGLKIEEKLGAGFISFPIDVIINPTEEIRKILQSQVEAERHPIYEALRSLIC